MVSTIRFTVVTGDRPSLGEVRIYVDDVDLVDLVSGFEVDQGYEPPGGYGGLIPANYDFGPMSEHYLGQSKTPSGGLPDEVPILGCACGEWGCWPLMAHVVLNGNEVLWSDFNQPHRRDRDYTAFGPFTFERHQFEQAVAELEDQLG